MNDINHQKQYQQQTKNDKLSLFDEEENTNHSIPKDNNNNNNEMINEVSQKVIPLFAEKIIISKRKVKVGEIIINKRKVTEDKKINFEIMREKITLNYADGRKENIIE